MKNKILIFLFSFIFVFNINVIDSFASPILIPEIIIDYVEYVTSAAGVRYKNREQVYSVAQGYYDNMSEMEKADLYQEAEGYAVSSNDTDYYVKDGFDILWKLDKVAFSVLKDVLKERIFDFTDYIMNKIVDGSASFDSGFSDLDDVLSLYDVPSFSSLDSFFSLLDYSSLSDLIQQDSFVVFSKVGDSVKFFYVSLYSDDIFFYFDSYDNLCVSGIEDCLFVTYYADIGGSVWNMGSYGSSSVSDFLGSDVLWCNHSVSFKDGSVYESSFDDGCFVCIDDEKLSLSLNNVFDSAGRFALENEIDSKADEADKVVLLGPTFTEDGELDYSLTDKLGTTFVPTTDLLDKAGQTYKDPITSEVESYNWLSKFWIGLSNAFVPNEYLLKVELLGLQSSFDKKFSISDTFDLLSVFDSADSVDLPDFYFPLFGNKYLICTGSYILEFTKDFRSLLRAFLWFCLVLVDIDQIYFIVRGVRLIRSIGSVDGGGSE